MSDFCVLLTETPRVELRGVSRPIAKLLRVPLIDVTTHLRKVRGVVYKALDEDIARQVAELLVGSGQPARVLPASELVELPRPKRITWAQATEESLRVGIVYEDEKIAIPWGQVYALSVGVVRNEASDVDVTERNEFKQMMQMTVPEERQMMRERLADQILADGASDALVKRPTGADAESLNIEALEDELDVESHLDLILSEPWFCLRISRSDFCYSSLAEGTFSATENFKILVRRIAGHASCHQLPIGARFIEDRLREADVFDDLHQYDLYNAWQFQLLQLPSEPASPAPVTEPPHGSTPSSDPENGG